MSSDGGPRPPERLLYDLQVTFRLIDDLLEELDARDDGFDEDKIQEMLRELSQRPARLAKLPDVVIHTYREIHRALANLRQGRDELRQIAVDRLPDTHAKLQEVSSATELAATDMLDRLDRALTLVQKLESDEEGADATDDEALAELKHELHNLISALQFQDITTQQLRHASEMLRQTEDRLARLAALFGEPGAEEAMREAGNAGEAGDGQDDGDGPSESDSYDPGATMLDSDGRQAVADEIFQ